MLYIITGKNTIATRQRFVEKKGEYKKNNYLTYELNKETLFELDKWLYNSNSLFEEKKVFFIENILSKKENREYLKKYDTKNNDIDIIIWEEDFDEKSLKFIFTHHKTIVEKLPQSIFTLLDALIPGNKTKCLDLLQKLSQTDIENIIFFMIQKRVRELLCIKQNISMKKKLAVWQIAQLKKQADKWDLSQLKSLYEALYRIEVNLKNGRGYYGIIPSLDILFCFYV